MSFTKHLCVFLLCAVAVLAQNTPSGMQVIVSDGPSAEFYTRYAYTSGTITHICASKHYNELSTVTQSAISNAASAVVTATAHGLHPDSNPTVVITGGTGNWAAFNGTRTVTVIDANSFSVPVNSTGFGAVAGTIVIKTNAPRTSRPIWVVTKVNSDASGTGRQSSMTAVGGYSNICDSRSTLSFQ